MEPDAPEDSHLKEYAATRIAAAVRGHLTRSRVQALHSEKEAVTEAEDVSQATFLEAELRHHAAGIIQKAWQSFRNHRIYSYYRDLIQFKERGDPRELLKSINPREAQLADAAAGIHLRFRLGGTLFPPLIFYKIYTHRPVTDICSFCPRDYVNERRLRASEMHNKPSTSSTQSPPPSHPAMSKTWASVGWSQPSNINSVKKKVFSDDFEIEESYRQYYKPDGTLGYRSTHGWYEREEKNGWRPISERILVEEDPITLMTKLKRMPFFHHSPVVRREEKVRKAKQRKREWLAKMYRDAGAIEGGADHKDSRYALATEGEEEDLFDGPLDDQELLCWSEHLDFEGYNSSWLKLSTSLGSEAYCPERVIQPDESLLHSFYLSGTVR